MAKPSKASGPKHARLDGVRDNTEDCAVLSDPKNSAGGGRVALRWFLVIAWACFIFFMSSHTGDDMSTGFMSQVKQLLADALNTVLGYHRDPVSPLAHFCEYLVFGVLLCNALRSHMSFPRACMTAIVIASVYGVTDEVHQYFVPGRECDPVDWAVDTAGATLGTMVYALIMRRHALR